MIFSHIGKTGRLVIIALVVVFACLSVPAQAFAITQVPYEIRLGDRYKPDSLNTDPGQNKPVVTDEGLMPGIDLSTAKNTTLSRLLSADKTLDSQLVKFNGEAVGEPINASDGFKWVLVDSEGSALSVLMTDAMAEKIEYYGRFEVKGSTLQIIGVYHVADPEETGELDVVAVDVESVDPGGVFTEELNLGRLYMGIGFLAAAAVSLGIYFYLRNKVR